MIKLFLLLLLIACEEDDKQSIFTSQELLSYESEQHTQIFDPKVNSNNKLDILLVIDNSGSMYVPQQQLAKNLAPLLEYIKDNDWQIAITSSDTRDGIAKIINKDNKDEFAPTITGLGTNGITNEAVLFKAIQALKGNYLPNNDLGLKSTQLHQCIVNNCLDLLQPCSCETTYTTRQIGSCEERQRTEDNKPWLRDDSMLAILLVTDEDHQCHDQVFGCTINDFYFYLKSIRVPHATVKVYGLLGDRGAPSDLTSGFVGGNNWFTRWRDGDGESLFAEVPSSIYNNDYNSVLVAISRSIATSIEHSFTLDHAHDDKSEPSVTFVRSNGKREPLAKGQYRISGSSLRIIAKIPDDIEKIEVSYSYGK